MLHGVEGLRVRSSTRTVVGVDCLFMTGLACCIVSKCGAPDYGPFLDSRVCRLGRVRHAVNMTVQPDGNT